MMKNEVCYGIGDLSYQAAGGVEGIKKLVDDFYDNMEQLNEASVIRAMHSPKLDEAREKLSCFLCGWLGGPRLYFQKYGPINIPDFHKHLVIGQAERDAWLLCMEMAIKKQDFTDGFKRYLFEQLQVPAERIRLVSAGKN